MSMMFRRLLSTAVLGAAMLPAAALAQETTIRLGHVLPESHSWHQAAMGFAEQVAEETQAASPSSSSRPASSAPKRR